VRCDKCVVNVTKSSAVTRVDRLYRLYPKVSVRLPVAQSEYSRI